MDKTLTGKIRKFGVQASAFYVGFGAIAALPQFIEIICIIV